VTKKEMPGAVLRVWGARINVARFLEVTQWQPLTVYLVGEPRFEGSKRVSEVNGFNVSVSSIAGGDFPAQLRDATKFFRKHGQELRRLKRMRLSAVLDFGIDVQNKSVATYLRFPSVFVSTIARFSVELEVSCYDWSRE
jgi:hypothetical protein